MLKNGFNIFENTEIFLKYRLILRDFPEKSELQTKSSKILLKWPILKKLWIVNIGYFFFVVWLCLYFEVPF